MSPILAARDLACGYGARRVLEGFELTAEPGTLTVLLGPNGAGKSTALRALARLLAPRQGVVTLDGRDVWSLPRAAFARQVAFLPQQEEAAWPMTVEQVVELGRLPHRGWFRPSSAKDRRALAEALSEMELTGLASRDLASLSGGERRRAFVARALAQEAEVLLLDEPCAHLDLRHQIEVLSLLHRRARLHGSAIVASLHELTLAAPFADRAVLFGAGRILAQGAPREVLTADHLRTSFGLELEVYPHPQYGTPLIVPAVSALAGILNLEEGSHEH